jgi:endonuclease-3
MDIEEIIGLLEEEYGNPRWQSQDPISVLVATILSQNTSDANSRRAFVSLLANFASWETVMAASVNEIAKSIREGGLAYIKAKRIKLALQMIQEGQDSLNLSFLSELSLPEAKAWLRGLPGVGPKTAGCVLLFSFGRPALPVDTHVFRVSKRLGLISSKASLEEAHESLEALVPAKGIYQFHLHMVEHGRRVCRPKMPLCQRCVLGQGCPNGLFSKVYKL